MTGGKLEGAKKLFLIGAPQKQVTSNLGVSLATLSCWMPATARVQNRP